MNGMKKFTFIYVFLCCLLGSTGYAQTPTDEEYKEWAKYLWRDERTKEEILADFNNYRQNNQRKAFSYNLVLHIDKKNYARENLDKILVIANSGIYEQVKKKINRYADDIHTIYGCEVYLLSVSGGGASQIKNLIKNYQAGLDGVVFIGNIYTPWYEMVYEDEYSAWLCDLYYMDLDGIWNDVDGNGIYDSHTGDVKPEIFVGHISTANMGDLISEKEGLEKYLDKNHAFWSGQTPTNRNYSLSYIDKDWINISEFQTGIQHLYGAKNNDILLFGNTSFGKQDYLNRLKNERYEFFQLFCHSSPIHHAMTGAYIYANEIFKTSNKALGCNLFCCSACDWTQATKAEGFLGGAYLYGSSSSILSLVGSTKTGSMQNFQAFYSVLGQGKTMGESLKTWWINAFGNVHNVYRTWWHYGMTILGDPLVKFFCVYPEQLTISDNDIAGDATDYYFVASQRIEVVNMTIPNGKHVVFNAPTVILGEGFLCEIGGTFEIITGDCN